MVMRKMSVGIEVAHAVQNWRRSGGSDFGSSLGSFSLLAILVPVLLKFHTKNERVRKKIRSLS